MTSQSRLRRALFVGASLLAAVSAPCAADDSSEFADFMIEAMTAKPGARMEPLPLEAEQDLKLLARLVFEVPHPPRFEDLEATVRAVMDPGINSREIRAPDWQNSQKELVDEILKLVDHGAYRIDDSHHFSSPRKRGQATPPSAQMRHGSWLVRLPRLDVSGGNKTGCRDLQDLLNVPPEAKGVLLDLRETKGGDFFDVVCLGNAFVAPGTELFLASRKPDEMLTFKASSKIGRTPIDLPLVILISRNTERVPLTLAVALRGLARARLIGERPAIFDGTYFEEFRFKAFGEFLMRDKNDHDGTWIPMRIVMPVGEISLPSGYPPEAVLRVDVPVPASDERAVFKAAENEMMALESSRK